jgi:hypothetical protein
VTRDEQNRALAEWLTPDPQGSDPDGWNATWRNEYFAESGWQYSPVDFFADESASALLLDRLASLNAMDEIRYGPEEMEIALMVVGKDGVDELKPKHGYERIMIAHQDRKTAIALAALVLIETTNRADLGVR